jgi:hypothetical protein
MHAHIRHISVCAIGEELRWREDIIAHGHRGRHDRHVRNERRHVAIGIEGVRTLVVLHIGVLVRIEAMDIVALVLLMLRDVGEGHVDVDRHRRRR